MICTDFCLLLRYGIVMHLNSEDLYVTCDDKKKQQQIMESI
jgi:hypothetical protein